MLCLTANDCPAPPPAPSSGPATARTVRALHLPACPLAATHRLKRQGGHGKLLSGPRQVPRCYVTPEAAPSSSAAAKLALADVSELSRKQGCATGMGSKPSRASTPASEHCAARLAFLPADRFHGDSPAGARAGSPRSGRPRSSPTLIGQAGKSVAAKASGNAASRVSGNAPRAGTLVDHDQLWPWILPRRLRSSVFPDFG